MEQIVGGGGAGIQLKVQKERENYPAPIHLSIPEIHAETNVKKKRVQIPDKEEEDETTPLLPCALVC